VSSQPRTPPNVDERITENHNFEKKNGKPALQYENREEEGGGTAQKTTNYEEKIAVRALGTRKITFALGRSTIKIFPFRDNKGEYD